MRNVTETGAYLSVTEKQQIQTRNLMIQAPQRLRRSLAYAILVSGGSGQDIYAATPKVVDGSSESSLKHSLAAFASRTPAGHISDTSRLYTSD